MSKVFYADLWGLREEKHRYLWENDVSTTDWQTLELSSPYFFFVPKNFNLLEEYEKEWKVTEIFREYGTGCESRKDKLWIAFDRDELLERLHYFSSPDVSEEDISQRLGVQSTKYWKILEAKRIVRSTHIEDHVKRFNYRPFDEKFIYYNPQVIPRGSHAYPTMRHMLQENICMITNRQIRTPKIRHFWVTNLLVDRHVLETAHAAMRCFPLYLYATPEDTEGTLFATEEVTREPNLSPKFIAAVEEKLGLKFVREGKGDLEATFGPEDILHYAYAVFHSPTYRERYAELLKIDFPRLPLTSDRDLFKALAEKGEELVSLHLMESSELHHLITNFGVSGSDEVEKVRYVEKVTEKKKVPADTSPRSVTVFSRRLPLDFEHQTQVKIRPKPKPKATGRVYINKTQYFEGIEPEVWEFQIGGYQVLHKWLKDRKGRKLDFNDFFHYQKIVVALKETMRLMGEIDELIPAWPIE